MSDVINDAASWMVQCDHPGCTTTSTQSKTDHRLDACDAFEDAGWRIGVETLDGIGPDLCPEHATVA